MYYLWMYFFSIACFGYVHLFAATFLFSFKLIKRRYYWLRLIVGFAVGMGILALFAYIMATSFSELFRVANIPSVLVQQLLILSMNFGILLLTTKTKLSTALLCFLSAVATQSVVDDLSGILMQVGALKFNYFTEVPGAGIYNWIIFYTEHIALTTGVFFIFGRRNSENIAENKMLLWSLFIMLFICLIVNAVTSTYDFTNNAIAVTYRVLSMICALFILFMREEVQKYSKTKSDLIIADQLIKQQARQYEQTAQSIELVNIKCHDLRRQIYEMENGQKGINVQEIAKIVRVYDAGLKTGNETLDVILIGKSLFCEANSITLTCMLDGGKLSKMSTSDLHALFGNLLDNAIEYITKIDDPEKRFIRVYSKEEKHYFILTVENYFEGQMSFDSQGIPVTTKTDKENHGYGTKSIKRIAERYGGFADMQVDCGLYIARVFIPI